MPNLPLYKPVKASKLKDHLRTLARWINIWTLGKIDELFFDGEAIQQRLSTPNNTGKLSNKFTLMMEKENVNRILKLLRNNVSNGALLLDEKTRNLLK